MLQTASTMESTGRVDANRIANPAKSGFDAERGDSVAHSQPWYITKELDRIRLDEESSNSLAKMNWLQGLQIGDRKYNSDSTGVSNEGFRRICLGLVRLKRLLVCTRDVKKARRHWNR